MRTQVELEGAIAADLIWRKKELTAYRYLIHSTRGEPERNRAVLRGALALLYAHFEGFVQMAARSYLTYVAYQRLKYEELADPFIALAARQRLRQASEANAMATHIQLAQFFRAGLSERAVLPYKQGVNTESNLSSRVLREIMQGLGLPYSHFEPKAHVIDSQLLGRRNSIAHGEDEIVAADDFEDVYQIVHAMLEEFRNVVSNAVASGSFRATQRSVGP